MFDFILIYIIIMVCLVIVLEMFLKFNKRFFGIILVYNYWLNVNID